MNFSLLRAYISPPRLLGLGSYDWAGKPSLVCLVV